MAPLRLLAALLAAHLQISFGQQMNEGNNLIAVASHKLAAIKQQSQQQLNVTEADQVTDSENNLHHNLDLKTDNELEQVNLNTSTSYPVGGTITRIKFVKNPAYDGPIPSFSIISSKDEPDPVSVRYDTTFFNLTNASPNDTQLNTGASQAVNQQTEDQFGFVGRSPLFISFTPQFSGALSSQSPYIISALPTQSSLSNRDTLQPQGEAPALQQKQQSHQTISSAQFQPSNVQSPASNMRLRFVPASTAVPVASTGPAQSSLPIQSTVPKQSAVSIQTRVPTHSTVSIQNTVPIQSMVPIQNTVPIQSTGPIQNTVLMQRAVPIQNTASIQRTVPIQNTASIQRTVPIQNFDNMVQNPYLSLLLTHLLSQNPIKPDDSAPTNIRYANQDQQQPSKQTVVKTLLPLLLQILTEKNNNCCEYKNKKDKSRMYSRYKQGNTKAYEKFDTDFGILSDTAHNFRHIHKNKRLNKPIDETLEEEDYSNESTDYSAEEYDDED